MTFLYMCPTRVEMWCFLVCGVAAHRRHAAKADCLLVTAIFRREFQIVRCGGDNLDLAEEAFVAGAVLCMIRDHFFVCLDWWAFK